jgi:hypothetical protein
MIIGSSGYRIGEESGYRFMLDQREHIVWASARKEMKKRPMLTSLPESPDTLRDLTILSLDTLFFPLQIYQVIA